eukprot:1501102-Pyramimonas_sp.AAC.1
MQVCKWVAQGGSGGDRCSSGVRSVSVQWVTWRSAINCPSGAGRSSGASGASVGMGQRDGGLKGEVGYNNKCTSTACY